MNIQQIPHSKRGFTLMELMVAMAITAIIVTVLVSITSIAIDTWNRSRAELRAARQGKAMVDTMARDFEGAIARRGKTTMDPEWLSAIAVPQANAPKAGVVTSSNGAKLIFFSASSDRYDGDIGVVGKDNGGDISCIAYKMAWKDPITEPAALNTFVVNRLLVNPDVTFNDLLGKTDLTAAFAAKDAELDKLKNFVCENVYQFTVTFFVELTEGTVTVTRAVPIIQTATTTQPVGAKTSFKIKGSGIEVVPAPTTPQAIAELKAGKVKAISVSLTVLSDTAIQQLPKKTFAGPSAIADRAKYLANNSYQYTKTVEVPNL